MTQSPPTKRDSVETTEPDIVTPDRGQPGDVNYFIWQTLGTMQQTLGRLDGRIESEFATLKQRLADIEAKSATIEGKVAAVSTKVSRATWMVIGAVAVMGALSPVIWAGFKALAAAFVASQK